MYLRTQYILFIVLIHLVTLTLSFVVFEEQKVIFIASELVILLSLYFSVRLYQALVKPLNMMLEGAEAIKDRDFNIKFTKTGKYEMDKLIGVYNQMIDELRKERRIQQEKHFFLEKLIQSSPTGIMVLDFNTYISDLNPKAEAILGFTIKDYQEVPIREIQHPLIQKIMAIEEDSSTTFSMPGAKTYKCHKSHFIDRGFQRTFILIEELTQEILQTEKKAYGKVIRMMAHEVNNSIGPINSILDSLLHYKPQLEQPDQETFERSIQVSMQRNQGLNQFMQNFAGVVRLPEPKREIIDLREVVQQVIWLYQMDADRRKIKIKSENLNEAFPIHADSIQMEQVLTNIVKNALEAIEEGGEVRIVLDRATQQLEILDNGPGIDPAVAENLFTPFFSTKKNGQGVGLTLIKEVLISHGFGFSLQSDTNGWTTFKISFQ